MRFVHVYLVIYFALIAGAAAALWRSGVLTEIPPVWLSTGAVVALGLGVLLAAVSTTPTTPT
jgi:hypothetical protein